MAWQRLKDCYGSPEAIENVILKKLEDFPKISNKDNLIDFPHLKSLIDYIPALDPNAQILLLLGRDILRVHKVHEQINGSHNTPYPQRTATCSMDSLDDNMFVKTRNDDTPALSIEDKYNDIFVTCGPQEIELSVYLCPVYFSGYNETQLYMNDIFSNMACQGTIDLSSSTVPLLKFVFSINDSSSCGSSFQITDTVGEGIFDIFSNIQFVNISGIIKSKDPTTGVITRSPELKYLYSCGYPLEYLMNNTRLDVAGNNIAITTNNGSFISTLYVRLFFDDNYGRPLLIPPTGIKLNQTVYVEVGATNLTDKFNVLLDRCYASTSPYPTNSTSYDLFVGCQKDSYTFIKQNGDSQVARFYFSAFRFLEQYQQAVSTFYLHCITRLCEVSACPAFKPTCAKRKRSVRAASSSSGTPSLSDPATVTSPGIITNADNGSSKVGSQEIVSTAVGLGITVGFLALLCTIMGGLAYLMHRRLQKSRYLEKNNFH
ncbi:PREDICTED: zona pellucida-like domain-containing protein 1 [Nanorana parkeri]|uniref:zona pellucida-like domain-containing protein 1 n=1 Tax=Nanorana parkeri TaxID=125878 RepID=UPI0008548AF3|nr:PREDICTED: zona pellucida-like domain-containing protein 1 [Nanorana parkeri]